MYIPSIRCCRSFPQFPQRLRRRIIVVMMSAHIYLFPDLKVSVNMNAGKDNGTGNSVETDTCTIITRCYII